MSYFVARISDEVQVSGFAKPEPCAQNLNRETQTYASVSLHEPEFAMSEVLLLYHRHVGTYTHGHRWGTLRAEEPIEAVVEAEIKGLPNMDGSERVRKHFDSNRAGGSLTESAYQFPKNTVFNTKKEDISSRVQNSRPDIGHGWDRDH